MNNIIDTFISKTFCLVAYQPRGGSIVWVEGPYSEEYAEKAKENWEKHDSDMCFAVQAMFAPSHISTQHLGK